MFKSSKYFVCKFNFYVW